jgi:hypothetical protein
VIDVISLIGMTRLREYLTGFLMPPFWLQTLLKKDIFKSVKANNYPDSEHTAAGSKASTASPDVPDFLTS